MRVLAILHGAFNASVIVLFFSEGWYGLRIRRARRTQAHPPPIAAMRRHRRAGPLLVIAGLFGYFYGLALILAQGWPPVTFASHFYVGTAIAILLLVTFGLSRGIKRPVSPFRTPHFLVGVLILALYLVQTYLGLRILFR
jgi:hypothetical protein